MTLDEFARGAIGTLIVAVGIWIIAGLLLRGGQKRAGGI